MNSILFYISISGKRRNVLSEIHEDMGVLLLWYAEMPFVEIRSNFESFLNPRRCKNSSVGQSVGLCIPRLSIPTKL